RGRPPRVPRARVEGARRVRLLALRDSRIVTPATSASRQTADVTPAPRLRHRIEYALFRLVHGLLATLPLAWAMRLAAGVAAVAIRVDRRHRRIGLVNLAIAFPEKSVRERARI